MLQLKLPDKSVGIRGALGEGRQPTQATSTDPVRLRCQTPEAVYSWGRAAAGAGTAAERRANVGKVVTAAPRPVTWRSAQ